MTTRENARADRAPVELRELDPTHHGRRLTMGGRNVWWYMQQGGCMGIIQLVRRAMCGCPKCPLTWHLSINYMAPAYHLFIRTQHNTTQHNTTQHNTTQHNTIQYNTIQHNTTQHNTRQYNTIQYNTI